MEVLQEKFNEPSHDKINKMACAHSKDSDQPGPPSLIVFAVCMKKAWILLLPIKRTGNDQTGRMPRLI